MTRKRKTNGIKRVEIEERLSQDEYISQLVEADPAYRMIHKKRYCLSENGLYYNIDIYPQWNDQALMDIELYDRDEEVIFPEGMERMCCGQIWEPKGMLDIADRKSAELEAALWKTSEQGRYPVLCAQSPCLHRMKKVMSRMKLYETFRTFLAINRKK